MSNLAKAQKFEKQLNEVVSHAMLGASLHKLTKCVGMATLTWATVVLMGGFASDVAIDDFMQVTFLVVWIACLLGLALFSSKLVTKKSLYIGSLDPVYLCYSDKRLNGVTIIQWFFIATQFFAFILPCALIAISSLKRNEFKAIHIVTVLIPPRHTKSTTMMSDLKSCLQVCASTSVSNSTIVSVSRCVESCFAEAAVFTNLQVCLFSFCWLVLVTCILAFLCLAYIAIECSLWRKRELSLKKYHDEVMSRALSVGMIEADEFDAREFFLRGLGEDLVIRNIGPLEVKNQNSEAIDYLYYHPKGVEMVNEGLSSDDTMRQQTSANIVGFWARRHNLQKNTPLLSKLAEKLGLPGKTAEAAANSFSALAVEWGTIDGESPLLKIRVTSDGGEPCNVVVKVMDLVLRRRLPTLQVYIRLLDSFFTSHSVWSWLAENKPQDLKDMKKKLLSIAGQEAGVQRHVRRNGGTNPRIDPTIRARTGFLAFSAIDRLIEFEKAARSNASFSNFHGNNNHINATLVSSQLEAMNKLMGTPKNSTDDISQGTTNPDDVISNAPANSGNHASSSDSNIGATPSNLNGNTSQGSTNPDGVISNAPADSTSSASSSASHTTNHTNSALISSQEAMKGTPSNSNGGSSQGQDGVENNAPTNSGNSSDCNVMNDALNNSHGSTHNINNSSVISNHSTSSGDNDDDDWDTTAKMLLTELDNELKSRPQEFMWWSEEKRYRELCGKYPPVDNRTCLGTWLDSCQIRGKEYQNRP